MSLILAILLAALAQTVPSTSAGRSTGAGLQDSEPHGVLYLEGKAQRGGITFRFVGVERPMPAVAASAKGSESAGAAQRLFGPLAISELNAAAEEWALEVRVPVPQEAGLPLLERRDGAACSGSAHRGAPSTTVKSSTDAAGDLEERAVAAPREAALFSSNLHDRAIGGLAMASAIVELRAGAENLDSETVASRMAAFERSASAWLAQREPQESIATLVPLDAMGLVATIEYWDARQALLGALSKPKDAALARDTLYWHLKHLGTTRLLGLLDERVPAAGTGFRALTACPSWPHDAWEVVEAESRLRAERDELQAKLRERTESAARRFDDSNAAMLRKAMGFVEDSLPPGLKVDQKLLQEIEEYLSRPLDEDTVVRADMSPAAVALARNEGNAELTTRAWEVWGRLLATGGLPPAEAARRRSQIDGWYEMAAQRAMRWDETGRTAQAGLDAMAGAFESLMSDPWSGWAFRAMPDSVYEGALRKARGSLSLALQDTPAGDMNGLLDALRISAWETHLELQRVGLDRGELRSLTPFPKDRTLDAGHGMAVSNAPARRRLMLDPVGMYPPGNAPTPR